LLVYWITLKALEKDRNRRYETNDALARDIVRYLNDEPIEARPPSFGYLMGRPFVNTRCRFLRGRSITRIRLYIEFAIGSKSNVFGTLPLSDRLPMKLQSKKRSVFGTKTTPDRSFVGNERSDLGRIAIFSTIRITGGSIDQITSLYHRETLTPA
jgi:hypothetical protein